MAWTNHANAKANDGTYAYVGPCSDTQKLRSTNFGFTVPDGATITGYVATVDGLDDLNDNIACMTSDPPIVPEASMKLTLDSTLIGGKKHSASDPYLFGTDVEGPTTFPPSSTSDTWGTSLSPADVRDSSFGVSLWIVYDIAATVNVDYITLTVFYTGPAGERMSESRTGRVERA